MVEEAAHTITSPQLMVGVVVAVAMRVVNSERVLKVATVRRMVQMAMVDITVVEVVAAWEARHRRPLV